MGNDTELLEALERLGLLDTASIPHLTAKLSTGRTLAEIVIGERIVTEAQLEVARRFAAIKPTGFGKYRIEKELGRGGMGVVYQAEDLSLGRRVALKILAGAADDPGRFEQEARLLARLRHPGIVTIYDFGSEIGVPFIAMELVEGQGLDDILRTMSSPARSSPAANRLRVDLAARVEIVRAAAEAVQAAHAAGVIHRDLKPGNVLIDRDLRPHITDFGLAREVDARARLTLSGTTVGTPAYMAPEQARGGPVDARADVYGLGVILYELLTLKAPFQETSIPALIRQVCDEEPARPSSHLPGLDRSLEAVCLKAMAKRPQDRYATAGDLAQDLARWLAGEAVAARPPGLANRVGRFLRRHWIAAGGAAAAVSATLLLGLLIARPSYFEYELATPGATVELDGRAVPPRSRVSPGRHRVVVRLPGFRTLDETLDFAAGQTTSRRFELSRPEARILVKPGDGCRLRLAGPDGIVEATTPWGPTSVTPGRYDLELWAPGTVRIAASFELADGATWSMVRPLPSAVRWARDIGAMDQTPLLADVDGDKVADVVVPSDSGRLYALSGATGDVLWDANLGAARQNDPVLVMLKSGPAIAQSMVDGRLLVFDAKRGTFLCGFRMQACVHAGGRFMDVTGDGQEELLFTLDNGTVGCVEATKASPPHLPWTQTHAGETGNHAPQFIEGPSGRRAVAVLTSAALTLREPATGALRHRIPLDGSPTVFAVADALGGPDPEALVGAADGTTTCLDLASGKRLWTFKAAAGIRCAPVVADLDGDGAPEVVVCSEDHHAYVLSGRDGSERWRFKTGEEVHARAAVGDVDGDGRPDVVIGSDDDNLYVLDGATGRLLWSFTSGDDLDSGLALTDVDGDGVLELIVCGNDGKVRCLGLKGK